MVYWEHLPAVLCERPQWVCWRYECREGDSKPTKVPYMPNGSKASSNRPQTWRAFGAVRAAYEAGGFDGVGYVFSPHDRFTGVDLDNCGGTSRRLDDWALRHIRGLDSYTELTPSGDGVHIIVEATLPGGGRKHGNVEVYAQGRYFTMTGAALVFNPPTVECRQTAIDALLATMPERKAPMLSVVPRPPVTNPEALVPHMLKARNGTKFRQLWQGDISGYHSWSEAELALCEMLAWWLPDAAAIDGLFRQSGLMRDRWDEARGETTQGGLTIQQALTLVTPRRQEAWSVPVYAL